MNTQIIAAYRFFRDNAAYVVGENARGALALARAEAAVNADEEAGYVWESDDEFPSTQELVCLVTGDDNVVAALGGIEGADANYRRVIEAELALEAGYASGYTLGRNRWNS